MATLAAAFARYFAQLVPPPAGIHGRGLAGRRGGRGDRGRDGGQRPRHAARRPLQVVGTVLKVGGVVTLIALPFVARQGRPGAA